MGIRKIFFKNRDKTLKEDKIENLRLFSVGLNGYLLEWSLTELRPKFYFENPGGSAIWDCDLISPKFVLLACDDGSPKCLRIKKNSILMEKQFSKQETKILSINSDKKSFFFTGHNDGSIKKWNFTNGQIELVLNLTSNKVKIDLNLIWTLFVIK
jgi:WD40 repeat protein